jgi:hypothetical protein
MIYISYFVTSIDFYLVKIILCKTQLALCTVLYLNVKIIQQILLPLTNVYFSLH